MPRPSIKIRGSKAKKKTGSTSQKESVLELAEKAVGLYQEEHQNLIDMQTHFEEEYPEASQFMQTIKQQEDIVVESIASAKVLVAQAGKTVGDFICKPKFSKPRYADEAFTDIVGKIEDGATVVELVKGGHVKKIALTTSATAWFAGHPTAAEAYKTAWEDSKELTAAVTTPPFK